jgi:hypothetical protein
MLSPRVHSPPKQMFENGPGSEQARIEFGNRYTEAMRREWFSIGIHLGYVYEGSPIILPDGTPRPPDDVTTYRPTARPGSRAPHVWLRPGQSIIDLFGREFVLLRFGADPPGCGAFERAAQRRGVPFRIVDVDSEEARTLYERRLVLVRPDGQVAWRADAVPDDPLHIIDIVRGAEPAAERLRTKSAKMQG